MIAIYFSRKPCLQALIEIRAELGILNEGVLHNPPCTESSLHICLTNNIMIIT